jgi:hypothetical protein
MTRIFSDMSGQTIEPDDSEPGVFVKAKKTAVFIENDLREHALYSMITDRRSADVSPLDVAIFRLKKLFRRIISGEWDSTNKQRYRFTNKGQNKF